MYEVRWSPHLRQGDSLGPLLFPLASAKLVYYTAPGSWLAPPSGAAGGVQVPASARHAAVVSHDCEFNEGKRNYLALARIESVDRRMDADALGEFRRANDA